MTSLEQSWCPTCREWSVLDLGEACAWCDTRLVRPNGSWKLAGRINEPRARAIHHKYMEGISARTLARELHQTLGYKTPNSCEQAIGRAFHRYGLPVRDRIAATVLASTSSGLSPRDDRERRRRRKAAGLVGSGTRAMQPRQPTCAGERQQYPRKGQPCTRPAMFGSLFCHAHDPQLREQRDQHLAAIRARQASRSGPKTRRSHRKETTGWSPPAA